MKYSYNWLKELSGTKKSPEQLADLLTMKAFEVESVEKLENKLDGVVVGKILEIKKHPNADKLSLVELTTNNKQQTTVEVVCGANNIKVGDKVPLAMVGTKLPSSLEIKEAEIRGVKSRGMLCAEDELGLGKDHGGILILDKNAKIGNEVFKELGLDDTIIDIDVLANRGHDALSHIGMVREICTIEGRSIPGAKLLFRSLAPYKAPYKKRSNLSVVIKDKKLCPRYIGAVMENIEVKESPAWAKVQLRKLGINPINNIVDATNYVMLELGQPLHAFDFEKIKCEFPISKSQNPNVKIIVRKAKQNEEIKLLDGTIKKLSSDDLVIANEKKALALAGIMGGEDSGISSDTKTVILESANFNAASVRKTRMRLGLPTDAALRFEKEIDPNLAEAAMARLIQIIGRMGGKTEGVVDVYPSKARPWKIKLDLNYVNKLLGENIPASAVKKILNSLEIQTKPHPNPLLKKEREGKDGIVEATIPTFRLDLKTQEDLIEEIGRIYGYEKIKSQAPRAEVQAAKANRQRLFERQVKNILAGGGFSETYNYSFYGVRDADLAQLGAIRHLELENPANPEQQLTRVSLIPNILKNIRENLKHFKEVRIFECGRVYWPNKSILPREKRMLVGAIVLEKDKKAENFFEDKGYVDNLLSKLGMKDYFYDNFNASPIETFDTLWHEGRRAEIRLEEHQPAIGFLGEINPLVLADFDIHKRVACFEFDLDALRLGIKPAKQYQPISKYPTVTRDISMLAPGKVKMAKIVRKIKEAGGKLILDVQMFDIFEKDGETSYAFHIEFGSDRTLESGEVDEIMQKTISVLEKNLEVKVRK